MIHLCDFEKLNYKSDVESGKPLGNLVLLFQPKIISAVKKLIDKKKRPNIESIYNHISKTKATNVDKKSVEDTITELVDSFITEVPII